MGLADGVPGFISKCLAVVCGDRAAWISSIHWRKTSAQGRVSATEICPPASWAEPSRDQEAGAA